MTQNTKACIESLTAETTWSTSTSSQSKQEEACNLAQVE